VGLPRGCLDEAVELIRAEGAEVELNDLRVIGNPLASRVRFQGTLYEPQLRAFEALLPHENGVLAATTAFGKTVVAAALIAKRGCNALVLSIAASYSPSGWSG
jgi:superfamily II DNA or RNA helicase